MSIVEDIENKVDIVELVGRYATLKKAGTNFKALCPFPGHNEKTASFVVSPVKQIGYCFGCHKGGGPIKFTMDIEDCEFKEALQILGNFAGIEVNNDFDKEKYKVQKSLYSIYKDAVNYYKAALEKYPDIKKYLMDRGLKQETINKFNFGYADSGVELYNYLKNKGYDDNLIDESKIFLDIRSKKDKFINRIIFPIQNLRGDFVALAGRIVGSGEPKYLNSPTTKVYDKSSILYGIYEARNSIKKEDYVIITEGYMDVIALQEAGFINTVCVSGTALTDKHLNIIKRLTNKIYLCFDGDKAGTNATKLSLENMKNKEFEVKIIMLKGGSDPDDIIKSGKDFGDYIKNAKTPIGYYMEKSQFDKNSIEEKRKLLELLLNIVKSYSNDIEKDFYLKEISKLLDISQKIIYDSYNKIRFKREYLGDNKVNSNSITSEEIAIANIIIDDKNRDILNKNIIFPENLNSDLKKALNSGSSFLDKLTLDKKERYRGISLKIDEENKLKTEENSRNMIEKLAHAINVNIYKKITSELKEKMNSGDMDAFGEYSSIVKIGKENGIK